MTQPGPAVTMPPMPENRAKDRTRTYVLAGQPVEPPRLAAGLHLVATPIGNLRDITLRALETLAAADVIACEDTRVTRKLLDHYGITTPLTPYHEHNAAAARPKLLARLAAGEAIALVSDAGTPLISDPGFKLVRAACEAGHRGERGARRIGGAGGAGRRRPADRPVLLRGLPAGRRTASAGRRIAELARIPATLILYESGPRIGAHARRAGRGARRARRPRSAASSPSCTRRSAAAILRRWRRPMTSGAETRGEFVIVVAPPAADAGQPDAGEVDALLRRALQHASVKDAVSDVAAATGRPRREIYQRALALERRRRWRGARDQMPPRGPRPERVAALPRRAVGGKPRRGLSDRQGLSHRGAALPQPGRRGRHRRAPPRRAGVRRGEGAQHARRRGRVAAAAPAAPDRRRGRAPGSPRIPTMPKATSGSTRCWSRRAASRATSRRRSRRNRPLRSGRAQLLRERLDLVADAVRDRAELLGHRPHRRRRWRGCCRWRRRRG